MLLFILRIIVDLNIVVDFDPPALRRSYISRETNLRLHRIVALLHNGCRFPLMSQLIHLFCLLNHSHACNISLRVYSDGVSEVELAPLEGHVEIDSRLSTTIVF